MSKDFDAWFAGFFDGEGSIDKSKFCRSLKIAQALTPDRNTVETFHKIKEMYRGNLTYYQPNYIGSLRQIEWRITKREDVKRVINIILPFIKLREKDLRLVLDFYKTCATQRKYMDINILYSNKSYKKIGKDLGCSATTICRMRQEKRNYFMERNRQVWHIKATT